MDNFSAHGKGLTSPADRWFNIAPADGADLAIVPRAIHCGGNAGTVVAVDAAGNESTFYLAQGAEKSIRPVRIKETGTTATGLVGLY
jgi:hypothetical protein